MNLASRRLIILFMLFLSVLSVLPGITIKLGSPLPEGTEWDASLRRMADQWREISDGKVRVRIYPGGIAGNEGDMVRKMRFGQLDAGIFTAYGLKSMVPETLVVTLPGLIRDDGELDYVLDEFVGRFDDRFREEGFEILAWTKSGWAYVYGKDPARIPDDLRRQALAIDSSESDIASAFKSMNFNTVPVALNEIMVALQSGLADALLAPPVGAAAYQWFALAPHMTDFRLAPVVGSMVISSRAWDRIPEEYHAELKASMAEVARAFKVESDRLNNEAMRVMLDNGLVVISPNPSEEDEWRQVMSQGHSLVVGDDSAVPTELYNTLVENLENRRR